MEDKATIMESLVDTVVVYTKSSIDLWKLIAIDKSANMLSSVISTIIISTAVMCLTMMLNIGVALWIGKLIGSSISGFLIVAGFYTVVVIVLVAFKKQLLNTPLSNSIISFLRKKNI